MDNMQKIDHLTKRSSELLADMRRLERENQKNKRRGDTLQKERDSSRTELSKTVGLKEKLEKLCRELQRDNNKMKVRILLPASPYFCQRLTVPGRMRIRSCRVLRSATTRRGTKNTPRCYPSLRAIKKTRTRRASKWWTWRWMNCTPLGCLEAASGRRDMLT